MGKGDIEWSDPIDCPTRDVMEFHLGYAGNLLKACGGGRGGSRVWEKHQIRRYLHPQLKKLWETHPLLKFYTEAAHMDKRGRQIVMESHTWTQTKELAKHFEGYVPLVIKDFGMVCDLDVLFLRAEPPGNVLQRGGKGGGDIDNRMKTLFDALCMPERGQARLKDGDDPDPSPLYVLLQDDSLITSIKVRADRFLASQDDSDPAEALLVLTANVKVADPTLLPYGINL